MNQTQRDYLIKQVEKTYRNEVGRLKKVRPEPPSLNNYLIASVLDGSFQLQDADVIKAHIRSLVLSLGPEKTSLIANKLCPLRGFLPDSKQPPPIAAQTVKSPSVSSTHLDDDLNFSELMIKMNRCPVAILPS